MTFGSGCVPPYMRSMPVLDDVPDLVAVRRVVADDSRVGRRQQVRVAVGVLETLAGQRGASGRCAHDEAARHLVAGRPHRVTGALESEHRIEHVDRDERLALGRVARSCGSECGERAGLVDAGVDDLTLWALLVGQEEFAVDRGVVLAVRVVDLRRREVRVHSEGARLIRDDRHDPVPEIGRLAADP